MRPIDADVLLRKMSSECEYSEDCSGLGGKECRLFTDQPIRRKPQNRQIDGQIMFEMDGENT